MSDYKKAGSKKIEGKKTKVVVYKKTGSSKLYVKRKDRMMNFVNYKKMCAKKLMAKKSGTSKVRKVRKVRKGGSSCNQQQSGGYNELGFLGGNDGEINDNEDMHEDMHEDVSDVAEYNLSSVGGKHGKQGRHKSPGRPKSPGRRKSPGRPNMVKKVRN